MKSESDDKLLDTSSSSFSDPWIVKFMAKKEHRYLDRIHDGFLNDRFNFFGLKDKIPNFEETYQVILDKAHGTNFENESMLYYLAHQRYVYSKMGLDNILDKVLNKEYGICCRIGCKDIPMVPIGLYNEPGRSGTKVYCFNCRNLYDPKGNLRKLDGCTWGNGFAHFLILTFPYHFERNEGEPYIPRIFGFQIEELEDNDSGD